MCLSRQWWRLGGNEQLLIDDRSVDGAGYGRCGLSTLIKLSALTVGGISDETKAIRGKEIGVDRIAASSKKRSK